MHSLFAKELNEATKGIAQADLARAIAQLSDRTERSMAAGLSRMINGKQIPRPNTIEQIAAAIATLKNLPSADLEKLRAKLLSAAESPTDLRQATKLDAAEERERKRLWRRCETALRRRGQGLTEQQIQTILQYARSTIMKLIIKADENGEDIEVVTLQQFSHELEQSIGTISDAGRKEVQEADTIIDAGRAKIVLKGKVSKAQRELLDNAAAMIRSVLQLQA